MRINPKRSILAGVMFTLAATSSAQSSAGGSSSAESRPIPVGTLYAQANPGAAPVAAEPDNSGRNVRDQEDRTLTPTDQSNAAADLEITTRIRKAIVSDDAMSIQAQNIKIITQRSVVTLRGPVKTKGEKATIESLAKSAGAVRIDNQLEIDRDIPSGEKE